MTKINILLFSFITILTSCQVGQKEGTHSGGLDMDSYYVENKLSFFNPYETNFENGRFTGYTYNEWIRKPENIIMVHETFKKIGYKKMFENYNYSTYCGFIHNVYKPCETLIDSLILTYNSDSINSKYYKEFWGRRKKEQNDSIVFHVLQEVYSIVYKNSPVNYNNDIANDTLQRLLEIRDLTDSITDTEAHRNFKYLRSIGMHGSAYNLLFERYNYYDINWNNDELKSTLIIDSAKCCPSAFVEDDTK
jgi:hypothetical protein